MKSYLLVVCSLFTLCCFSQEKLGIRANKNLELLGVMYTIVYENPDNPRYDTHNPDWEYGQWILEHYGQFGEDIQLNELLPKIEHLWISEFFSLLIKLDDFPNATLSENISINEIIRFSQKRDPIEARQNAAHFIKVMNQFYQRVSFDDYWEKRSAYYQAAIRETKSILNALNELDVAESFYQQSFERYIVFPSLTLPPHMGFATHSTTTSYMMFSARNKQNLELKQMSFDEKNAVMDVYIHELGHTLLNKALNQISAELFEKTTPAFIPIQDIMRRHNYLTWKGVLDEFFTRSGEVLIRRITKDKSGESRLIDYHTNEKEFIYLPLFVDQLWENYQQGNSYLTGMTASLEKLATEYTAYKTANSLHHQKERVIVGKVTEAQSGKPLPYVNIGIKGKNVGTVSREDGSFELKLKDYEDIDSIKFSTVGYKPYSIAIGDLKNNELLIYLSTDVKILNEVRITAKEINEKIIVGRRKATKTTQGQSNITSYGTGVAHGIRINATNKPFMLKEVNFHMRFNTTDSILFRINVFDIKDGLPDQSILKRELFMKSYKRQKWISKDFSNERLIINQDVIIVYEVVKVWFNNKTNNNIFFTYGEGYEQGGQYMRKSSFANWETTGNAFPIALYVTGRAL